MPNPFPSEPKAKRAAMLAAVEGIRETVQRHAAEGEQQGTLPRPVVGALASTGLFTMKLPAVLGGAEADPVTQIEVIEALSAIEPSAGWCLMIGATGLAFPGAFLSEEGISEMFPAGRIPTAAIMPMPAGEAVPVKGGYRLKGRWPFVSGVRHAQWATFGARVVRDGQPPEIRLFTLPSSAFEIHDNWQVAGLAGTGSCDVSVADKVVSDAFSWNREADQPRRGGPLYRMGHPGFVANEHAAVALGIGRGALDTMITTLRAKRRGFTPAASSLESRHSFQRTIGLAELKLRSARALVLEVYQSAWEKISAGEPVSARLQGEMRSVATFATEVAVEVTTQAFRHAGGSAAFRGNILQRYLRDINVAAQHLMVSDISYETLGQFMLGFPDVDPMR